MMLPVLDTDITPIDVKGFSSATSGIDRIAKAVLNGTYASTDERISHFYAARDSEQLDSFPLTAMRELAEAILAETEKDTAFVGAPNQLFVIPRKGKVRWLAPETRLSKERVLRTILWLGGPSNQQRTDGQHYKMHMSVFEDLTRPITEPYTQVFVGGAIQDVDVVLDGNIFAGFDFADVTFKYKGGTLWFGPNNRLQRCEIDIEQGQVLPAGNQLLATACRINTTLVVQTDASAVGTQVNPVHVGCVIPAKNGAVETKTTGKYKGQDCRGSHIQLPIGTPIPGTRASRRAE